MSMLHIREAKGTVDEIGRRLEATTKAHGFGVIGVVDLQAKMRDKGIEFPQACRIYEVCNPHQAKKILTREMAVSTVLPCRISVYEEDGAVKLATLLPTNMLNLFAVPELAPVAQEVERDIVAIMDTAAG